MTLQTKFVMANRETVIGQITIPKDKVLRLELAVMGLVETTRGTDVTKVTEVVSGFTYDRVPFSKLPEESKKAILEGRIFVFKCLGEERLGFKHENGGGTVEITANVDKTAHVGPFAVVLDSASVLDNAQIHNRSIVSGSALVRDNAQLFQFAHVTGFAFIGGNAKINCGNEGEVSIGGHVSVEGDAEVSNSRIFGNGKIDGDARVILADRTGDFHISTGYVTDRPI